MHFHFLQHVPFEDPAGILRWAAERGHTYASTKVYHDGDLPSPDAFDLLIIMGGPMSIDDEAEHPWLVDEKRFIREVIDRSTKVLGICLGAQLIADALGAKIYPGKAKEIGFFEIELTETGKTSPLLAGLPSPCPAFHWHGETFDLPDGAAHLARSRVCEHQAFSYENRVLALQFHLETTPESADQLIRHCADEMVVSDTVQSAAAMHAHPMLAKLPPMVNRVMDNLVAV